MEIDFDVLLLNTMFFDPFSQDLIGTKQLNFLKSAYNSRMICVVIDFMVAKYTQRMSYHSSVSYNFFYEFGEKNGAKVRRVLSMVWVEYGENLHMFSWVLCFFVTWLLL